jgi:hypothetical protein
MEISMWPDVLTWTPAHSACASFLPPLAVCLIVLLHAQCPPVVSPNPALYPSPPAIAVLTIGDFGAVQNDNCSDHDAFRAAAAWINARGGYTTLRIPNGEFIVGKQMDWSTQRFVITARP